MNNQFDQQLNDRRDSGSFPFDQHQPSQILSMLKSEIEELLASTPIEIDESRF